jgi:hypothetical protein
MILDKGMRRITMSCACVLFSFLFIQTRFSTPTIGTPTTGAVVAKLVSGFILKNGTISVSMSPCRRAICQITNAPIPLLVALALFLLTVPVFNSLQRGTGRFGLNIQLKCLGDQEGPALKHLKHETAEEFERSAKARAMKRPKNNFWGDSDSPIADRTIRLQHPDDTTSLGPTIGRYSKFRCSGNDNDVNGHVERLCLFENVCFDRDSNSFKFYRRMDRVQSPVLFDSRLGPLDQFSHDNHGFVAVKQLLWAAAHSEHDTFAPHIVPGESPAVSSPDSTIRLSSLHVLWSTWAQDDNLGHVLWEEMAGIWYAMIRMNVLSENATAMHWPDSLPERPLAVKFRDAFFPAISTRSPVSFYPYIERLADSAAPDAGIIRHVCFDQFLVGGNVRRFLQRMEWHNYGHEPLFFSLRARILDVFGLSPYSTPKAHRIVITRKTSSNYHPDENFKTHRSIYNIDEVSNFIKSRYPRIKVDVVDFKELSINDQLRLLIDTTVLITPPGGISMMLPFLPDGANAIILDYLEKEDDVHIGTRAGESVSMEGPFWNYWPHVKKIYYQVRTRAELRSDDPSRSLDDVSWRDEVSVNINLERLELLLTMAFDNMSS